MRKFFAMSLGIGLFCVPLIGCDLKGDDLDELGDYPYDSLALDGAFQRYEVIANDSEVDTGDHAELSVTIKGSTESTSKIYTNGKAVWDEVLAHGKTSNLATTWTVTVNGENCDVAVTKEMIVEWGGFTVEECGNLKAISFHLNPIK